MKHQMRYWCGLIALLTSAQPFVLRAQGVSSPSETVKADAAKATGRSTSDPLLSSGARNSRPQITAIATSADKTAKAQFGIDRATGSGILQLRVSASTPLAESADKTTRVTVADLSDLRGVSSGEFGASYTIWKAPSPAKLDEAVVVYGKARAKILSELQRFIETKEAAKISTAPRKDEKTLHENNLLAIDAEIATLNTEIQKALEAVKVPATAAAALATLNTALSKKAGSQVSRELEVKRHTDALTDIAKKYAASDASIDAEISILKAKKDGFEKEMTGAVRVVANSNPVSMRDPLFRDSVAAYLSRLEDLTASRPPILLGISGALGQKKYSYSDSASLAAGSQNLNSNQIRFSAGVISPLGFLSGFYSKQRSVSEKDQTQLCRPLKDHAEVGQCANTRIGAPTLQDKNLFGGEFRVPLGPTLMGALEVTRDVTNKLTAWSVPIYFMTDKTGVLNGGIVLGGQSKTPGYTLKIFVGAVSLPSLR